MSDVLIDVAVWVVVLAGAVFYVAIAYLLVMAGIVLARWLRRKADEFK